MDWPSDIINYDLGLMEMYGDDHGMCEDPRLQGQILHHFLRDKKLSSLTLQHLPNHEYYVLN